MRKEARAAARRRFRVRARRGSRAPARARRARTSTRSPRGTRAGARPRPVSFPGGLAVSRRISRRRRATTSSRSAHALSGVPVTSRSSRSCGCRRRAAARRRRTIKRLWNSSRAVAEAVDERASSARSCAKSCPVAPRQLIRAVRRRPLERSSYAAEQLAHLVLAAPSSVIRRAEPPTGTDPLRELCRPGLRVPVRACESPTVAGTTRASSPRSPVVSGANIAPKHERRRRSLRRDPSARRSPTR